MTSICARLGSAAEESRSVFAYVPSNQSVHVLYVPGAPKTWITGSEMKKIADLNPKKLLFHYVVFDREAKDYFGKLPGLEDLVMIQTNFGDTDVESLKSAVDLKSVNLIDVDVTDRSIDIIIGFEYLTRVILHETAVTLNGYRRLRKARPDIACEYRNSTSTRADED